MKEEIIPVVHKLFLKTEKEGMFSNPFDETGINLISKPDTDITRKEMYRPKFLTNTDIKFPYETSANITQK